MKELRIYDKVKNENYLIGFVEIIERLEQIVVNILEGKWEIATGAYGYGELICSIEDELKCGKQYLIDGAVIFPILKSGEQYFFHVCLKKIGSDLEIGVFDSTNIFLRTNNEELINQIKSFFRDIKILDC